MPTSQDIFDKLAGLGVPVPTEIRPHGRYELVLVHRDLAQVSGQVPRLDRSGTLLAGRLEADQDLEEARAAARLCLARALVALHQELGDLTRVERLISLRGFVNAAPDFQRHGQVMDAASDLAIALFGDAGRHIRSSLGVSSLPGGALVEIELTAAVARPH
ncbi:MAG: RidA family protein [Phreatobacter sp.]